MGAVVTRSPLHRDGATTGTETEFRDGRAGDMLPDDDGVERVAHEVVCCCVCCSRSGGGMAATPLILNQAVQQTHQVNLIIRQVGFETEFFKQEDCQIIGLRIGTSDGRFHRGGCRLL